MGLLDGLLGGIPSLLGGVIGGAEQSSAQSAANAANERINKENIAFQTDMSNTAVQRRTADMKEAGINPVLAAGNPASQPSYSPIPMQSTGQNFGQLGAQIGANAITGAQQLAQTRDTNASAALKEAQIPFSAENAKWTTENLRQQYDVLGNQAFALFKQAGLTQRQIDNQELTNDLQAKLNPLLIQMKQLETQAQRFGNVDLRNEAEKGNTWWGRTISPFLQDLPFMSHGANILRNK